MFKRQPQKTPPGPAASGSPSFHPPPHVASKEGRESAPPLLCPTQPGCRWLAHGTHGDGVPADGSAPPSWGAAAACPCAVCGSGQVASSGFEWETTGHLQGPPERLEGTLERQCCESPQGGATRVQGLPLCSRWLSPALPVSSPKPLGLSFLFCQAGRVTVPTGGSSGGVHVSRAMFRTAPSRQ